MEGRRITQAHVQRLGTPLARAGEAPGLAVFAAFWMARGASDAAARVTEENLVTVVGARLARERNDVGHAVGGKVAHDDQLSRLACLHQELVVRCEGNGGGGLRERHEELAERALAADT